MPSSSWIWALASTSASPELTSTNSGSPGFARTASGRFPSTLFRGLDGVMVTGEAEREGSFSFDALPVSSVSESSESVSC